MHKHTQNCSCCVKAKVSSLGKNWHRFCLKCERCSKILSPGGHAEHDGLPYCHKPCYGTLFGPKVATRKHTNMIIYTYCTSTIIIKKVALSS
uniref:Cysteine-rich protein 2-like n=1 Tax=Sinocyclocheilus anshuiensis TaxID=1608454 RepID=A0A671MSW3_9TELE